MTLEEIANEVDNHDEIIDYLDGVKECECLEKEVEQMDLKLERKEKKTI